MTADRRLDLVTGHKRVKTNTAKYRMRYRELLAEQQTLDLQGEITVFCDPSRNQIEGLIRTGGSLRGLADGHRVFVWHARKAIHPEVARLLVAAGEWQGDITRFNHADYQGWQCFLIRNNKQPFHAMEVEWQTEARKSILSLGGDLDLFVASKDAKPLLALPVIRRWLRTGGVVQPKLTESARYRELLAERLLPGRVGDPDFAAWFGQSQIVDANGAPLIVFHQTAQDNVASIEQNGFDISRLGARATDSEVPDGIFFKPSQDDIRVHGRDKVPVQMPFYLSIQNPLRVDNRAALLRHMQQDAQYRSFHHNVEAADQRMAASYDKLWNRLPPQGTAPVGHQMSDDQYDRASVKMTVQFDRYMRRVAAIARTRLTEILQQQGYDGLWMRADVGGGLLGRSFAPTTIIAFSPDQVRGAKDDHQDAIDRSWGRLPQRNAIKQSFKPL